MNKLLFLFIFIVALTACSNGNQTSSDIGELSVFFNEFPSEQIQQDLYDFMEQHNIGQLNMNRNEPAHIEKFPTFIIRGSKGEYETHDLGDLKEYLKQNY